MMQKNIFISIFYLFSVAFFSPRLIAGECSIDSNTLDRGETKAFIICGAGIPQNYILTGLKQANIKAEYEQYLKLCDIGKKEPGIYLILKAEDDAVTAALRILHGEDSEPVCDSLTITIPERVHIQEASLFDMQDNSLSYKILEIKADKFQDLSQACAEGLRFPEGKWPALSIVAGEEMQMIPPAERLRDDIEQPLSCEPSSIRALVNVQGQQRYPAKVIIPSVIVAGEAQKEGVAYVKLPPPAWLLSMRNEDAKYVDVNGIRTRYFEKGRGDPLLLVHGGQAGATSNAQVWEQNFDYLAQYFHVFAIDRIGQGYTDNPKTDKDYEEYYQRVAEHVYGFMQAVGIKKVHLIGHSQGGWPVTRIALDHPEMVKSLVHMGSVMAPDDPLARSMTFMMYIMFYVDPPQGTTLESIRRGKELWSYSMNNITYEKVQRAYKLTHLPKLKEARRQMVKYQMSPAHPSFHVLKDQAMQEIESGKLKVPTLIVWGYNDPSMIYEGGIELFKKLGSHVPDLQLHIFDECGHSPYIEFPEQFNRLIKSFCGKYAARSVQ